MHPKQSLSPTWPQECLTQTGVLLLLDGAVAAFVPSSQSEHPKRPKVPRHLKVGQGSDPVLANKRVAWKEIEYSANSDTIVLATQMRARYLSSLHKASYSLVSYISLTIVVLPPACHELLGKVLSSRHNGSSAPTFCMVRLLARGAF